ncbi:class I SAM-dependent methyltransferase [Thermococcus piezophilus]|uniref:Uncharacterized protein n=1 Tax=Thermococcus piezophilus TaxID=1712654 RepID=A0A172WFY0_9EURY|nr:class I SAM-dependent methyltransferase [Thermococcus piezophilus]ANF22354.1 hypothetical protein A7C91_03560 [Thermococcus piezophilus]
MNLQVLLQELEQKFGKYTTIEYILPSIVFYSVAAEYLNSFSLDRTKVRVLDVGSSYGYGVYTMSKLCPSCILTGVDISKTAVSVATDVLKSENTSFEVVDMVDTKQVLQFIKKYGKFDAITCFEVFEHILPNKSRMLLKNLNLLLKDSGFLFISTPNQVVYDVFAFTKDHINEVTLDKFLDALREYFNILEVYGSDLHPKLMISLFWNLGLVARQKNKKVSMPRYKKFLRKLLRTIFEPSEFYLSILKQTNYSSYLLKKLDTYKLNQKPENSSLIFVIAKKK